MSRFRYLAKREQNDTPTVSRLYRHIEAVSMDTACLMLLELFLNDHSLYALPVVDAERVPFALVDRHSFVEFFSRPFIREVHGRKSIVQFLASNPTTYPTREPIIVDEATSIDDVARIIIDAGMEHMVSGFIVTQEDRYIGIANGHDLLDDITQRQQADLYHLAHYDQLTQIPNRMLLTDRLAQACKDAQRSGNQVGLMFVDLDRFKQVNDTMGHRFADLLLREVAQRLQMAARDCDTVARLGGDEFAIVMDSLKDAGDTEQVAQRIVESLNRPFQIMEHEVVVTASIGIAIYPRDDTDISTLLSKADAAMYSAKSSGRNSYRTYAPGLSMYSAERLTLETDLRSALANDELVLHYQPQVNLSNEKVVGVEALVRWQHPSRGLLSPGHFIGIAEESGVIIEIGHWVLEQACLQQRRWQEEGLSPLRMAVNISALQFRQPNFFERVKEVLRTTGTDPSFIELELTENVLMHNAPSVLRMLHDLKVLGLQLAIDDFGTGFSSLSYLLRFPIDRLKVDRSFVHDIGNVAVNESIVRAISVLARSLGLKTIAEGTETDEEVALVRDCHCHEAQGYRFCKPLPAAEFCDWLRSYVGGYSIRDFFEFNANDHEGRGVEQFALADPLISGRHQDQSFI